MYFLEKVVSNDDSIFFPFNVCPLIAYAAKCCNKASKQRPPNT